MAVCGQGASNRTAVDGGRRGGGDALRRLRVGVQAVHAQLRGRQRVRRRGRGLRGHDRESGVQPGAEALRGAAEEEGPLQRGRRRPRRLPGPDHGAGNHPSGRRRSGHARGGRGQPGNPRGRGNDRRVAEVGAAEGVAGASGRQSVWPGRAARDSCVRLRLSHACRRRHVGPHARERPLAGRLPAGQGDPDRPGEGEDRVPAHHHRGLHRRRDAQASTAIPTGPRCRAS